MLTRSWDPVKLYYYLTFCQHILFHATLFIEGLRNNSTFQVRLPSLSPN